MGDFKNQKEIPDGESDINRSLGRSDTKSQQNKERNAIERTWKPHRNNTKDKMKLESPKPSHPNEISSKISDTEPITLSLTLADGSSIKDTVRIESPMTVSYDKRQVTKMSTST